MYTVSTALSRRCGLIERGRRAHRGLRLIELVRFTPSVFAAFAVRSSALVSCYCLPLARRVDSPTRRRGNLPRRRDLARRRISVDVARVSSNTCARAAIRAKWAPRAACSSWITEGTPSRPAGATRRPSRASRTASSAPRRVREPAGDPQLTIWQRDKRFYVGDQLENECTDYGGLHDRIPCERGIICHWDVQKTVWDRMIGPSGFNVRHSDGSAALTAQIDPEHTSLLVTEPVLNLPNVQHNYDQIIFEEFEFQSYLRIPGAHRATTTALIPQPPPSHRPTPRATCPSASS